MDCCLKQISVVKIFDDLLRGFDIHKTLSKQSLAISESWRMQKRKTIHPSPKTPSETRWIRFDSSRNWCSLQWFLPATRKELNYMPPFCFLRKLLGRNILAATTAVTQAQTKIPACKAAVGSERLGCPPTILVHEALGAPNRL